MKVTDIANAVSSKAKQDIVGVRPGEKLHEQMIGIEDAPYTFPNTQDILRFCHPSMNGIRIQIELQMGRR